MRSSAQPRQRADGGSTLTRRPQLPAASDAAAEIQPPSASARAALSTQSVAAGSGMSASHQAAAAERARVELLLQDARLPFSDCTERILIDKGDSSGRRRQ